MKITKDSKCTISLKDFFFVRKNNTQPTSYSYFFYSSVCVFEITRKNMYSLFLTRSNDENYNSKEIAVTQKHQQKKNILQKKKTKRRTIERMSVK